MILHGIQAARGIAALLVVLFHGERALNLPQYVGHAPWGGITGFGHAGVDFFFVLSGFIIFYVHHGDLDRPAALWRYATRRVCRIYPPYWVVAALLLMVGLAKGRVPDAADLGKALLLLPGDHDMVLGVAWTLVREMVFYVVFGIAIVDRRLAAVAVVVLLAVGQVGAFDLLFAFGMGAAWLVVRGSVPFPRTLLVVGAVGFLTAGVAENAGLLPLVGLAGRLAYGTASALMILGLARPLHIGPVLTLLGAASYSIYLVHSPMLGYAAKGLALISLPGWLTMVAAVVIAVAAGIVFHLVVEKPLTRAAQRLFLQRAATVGLSPT